MDAQTPAYRLVRSRPRADQPVALDEAQQAVVEHTGGPLLVLAGPGTGKTTTIVETIVHRVGERGIAPDRVLALTFGRKAAGELRERIASRLGRTTRQPLAMTFHSYAYALVRREFVLAGDEPPTLLSGPEQLLEVRRLLRGDAEDGAARWPERLRPALATRGFAAELRDFLLRAAERGLDGPGLARLGARRGRDDWQAAGEFLTRYAARFDLAPVPAYDYAEIVRIAAAKLAHGSVRERERKAYDLILVDEYQDTDPAQEAMLRALAGDGRELIVVGDPDQSIYAFRGADVGAIMRFPDRFRAPDGTSAKVLALRTCRRSGPVLLAASRRVAARLPPVPALSATQAARSRPGSGSPVGGHRDLRPAQRAHDGTVRIINAVSPSQEAAVVADVLRRAHLLDGVPWSSMAVLVRSVIRQAPLLRRALAAVQIPIVVAGDELPLTQEPGVQPLLLLLRCALRPSALDEEAAVELVTGPLGGADSLGMRRLRRVLRAAAQDWGGRASDAAARDEEMAADAAARDEGTAAAEDGQGRAAGAAGQEGLIAAALADPRRLVHADGSAAEAARRVSRLLRVARDTAAGATAEELLWAVWDASGLAAAWQSASMAGGTAGAAADRDLDAVVALFDAAARFTARLPPGSPWLFLDSLTGQEIPGDTLAEQAPHPDAVRLLTAHRAKGLEWDVVVVAGVQEGIWPDLRTRSSLLGMDALVEAVAAPDHGLGGEAAAAALASKLLSEERRLFYVAATRARRMLVVTAAGGDDSEERPSRFLAELAGDQIEIEMAAGEGMRWLSLPALVAALRRAACDPERPSALRKAAAGQLARLAAAGVRGARPREWYSLTEWTDLGPIMPGAGHGPPGPRAQEAWLGVPAEAGRGRSGPGDQGVGAAAGRGGAAAGRGGEAAGRPASELQDGGQAAAAAADSALVRVSPSHVEQFTRCGLRWLLEAAVGAGSPDVVRHFGVVIHAAAVLAATGAADSLVSSRLDEVWHNLDFGSAWYSERQREQAHQMVVKFLAWHRENPRRLVAVEQALHARIGQVEIIGRVDRLEQDDDGRAVVVDLKTGATPVRPDDLDRHPQLGVYQLAVLLGAFERFGLTQPGGAELVQVGKASLKAEARVQRQRPLSADPEPDWAAALVETVAAGMPGPVFHAQVNPGCRNCPARSCCPVHPEGEQVAP